MNKVCAITGSNGYVGSCIKKYFAARGWKILEFTRQPKPGSNEIKFQLGGEISPQSLVDVQALIHCAYDFKPLTWKEISAINVEGSKKVLAAARAAKIPKIIFISSISAFDGCRSLYGRAKLEIEKIAAENGALVIRPGLVYGNGPGGMFGKLTTQVRQSSIIPMLGNGSQIQFLVHNEDLAAFIEQFAAEQTNVSARVLTAANAQPWPFKQLLLEIARATGRKPRFIPLPWRLVWAGLKLAESGGLKLNFRSDSLISLIHQNPAPDFSANAKTGLSCRPFEIQKLEI